MSSTVPEPALVDNPAVAARRAVWANLASQALSKPVLTSLIAVLCLTSIGLLLLVAHALLAQHAATVLHWLSHRAAVVWAAIALLSLAHLVSVSRRDASEAESGWLSALPQMPAAMRRWSRWRTFGLAALQAVFLSAFVVSVHGFAPGAGALSVSLWLPAVVVPLMAWLLLPLLSGSRKPALPPASSRRRASIRERPASVEPVAVLTRWQWADYRSRRWTAGTRWSLGLVALLVPATATLFQVAVTVAAGVLLLQWFQLWSSCLRVVVQAGALTAALPQRPWSFLLQLSWLPLLAAVTLPLFVLALLAGAGLPLPAALIVALVVFGALTLQAATVLAWRHRPRLLGLRSAGVLLAWSLLSQAVPWSTPLLWLFLTAWLLLLAGRAAS